MNSSSSTKMLEYCITFSDKLTDSCYEALIEITKNNNIYAPYLYDMVTTIFGISMAKLFISALTQSNQPLDKNLLNSEFEIAIKKSREVFIRTIEFNSHKNNETLQ